ncbi:MAG: CHAT domain-containing protein [bacterium]|nr:CHAT domain-containing protein [bacterium]
MATLKAPSATPILPLVVVLLAASCSGDAPQGPSGELDPALAAALETCPSGEEPWKALADQAKKSEAIDALRERAELLVESCPGRAESLWLAGEALFLLYRQDRDKQLLEPMRETFERSRAAAAQQGDPVIETRALNRIAYYHKRFDDYDTAKELYFRGLETVKAASGEARLGLEAALNNNLCEIFKTKGPLGEALPRIRAARASLKLIPSRENDWCRSARSEIAVLKALGRTTEALRTLDELKSCAQELDEAPLVDRTHLDLGDIYRQLQQYDRARSEYEQVEREENRHRASYGLGMAALAGQHTISARSHLERAIAEVGDDNGPRLLYLLGLAEVHLHEGDLAGARKTLAEPLGASETFARTAWSAELLFGKSLRDGGDSGAALEHFEKAYRGVIERGEELDPTDAGMGFLRARSEPFVELAAGLADRNGDESVSRVLQVVEQAHSRALRRLLGGDEARIADLAFLRSRLSRGELLIDFLIGHDRGVAIAVTQDTSRAATLPGWIELRQPVRRYVNALKRPLLSSEARQDPIRDLARDLERGREIRRALLGPFEDLLQAAHRIYVVPDQDLALLPFAALPRDGDGFLGDTLEVGMLPMAGAPPAWSGTRTPMLVAGDPVPDADGTFAALPSARAEIAAVAKVWGAADTVQADELRLERLLGLSLDQYRLLHFATHAVASTADPDQCAVILSHGEKLDYRTISRLKLDDALVVLSACQTGEGEIIPGEGVVGLTWAFLRAGARGVAASLWSVEDESTSLLMQHYHERLHDGDDPVAALSAAQRALRGTHPHPVNWAPFVIVLGPDTKKPGV